MFETNWTAEKNQNILLKSAAATGIYRLKFFPSAESRAVMRI